MTDTYFAIKYRIQQIDFHLREVKRLEREIHELAMEVPPDFTDETGIKWKKEVNPNSDPCPTLGYCYECKKPIEHGTICKQCVERASHEH